MSDRDWSFRINSRGCGFYCCEGEHVDLPELKEDFPYDNRYLRKRNIPSYPQYVFSVPNVCHVTEKSGLHGILEDGGFRGFDSYLWWDLSVNDIANQKKFTTSPAFKSESRYGNFRFTFSLRELLNIYSKQFCDYTSPILRVLDTRLYEQEIQYSVLVHPQYMTHYRKYPRLPIDDEHLCGYSTGSMYWKCQSPSDHYQKSPKRTEYYVWDHVAVAFHMKPNWILPLSHEQLFDHLSVCKVAPKNLLKEPKMSVEEAWEEVEYLKYIYL